MSKETKKPHILIATPMYGGMCTGFYTQSIISVPAYAAACGCDVSFSFMMNESLIQRARNALVAQFLKREECTHLMFIDADIKFNAQDIFMMLQADKDVICGIYPKKEINWVGVERAVKNGVPVDQWKNHTGAMVVNLVDYKPEVSVPMNIPLEVMAGGTGFMLIKRRVFEKLMKKVKSYTNDVYDQSGQMKADKIHEFFPVLIEPETNRLLSEDYGFCRLVRKANMKIYAAPWVHLGHFGSYLFEGGLTPDPNSIPAASEKRE